MYRAPCKYITAVIPSIVMFMHPPFYIICDAGVVAPVSAVDDVNGVDIHKNEMVAPK